MKEPVSSAKRPAASSSASASASASARPAANSPRGANNSACGPFFTEVVRAEICSVIAAGCMFRVAARYVGCTVRAIADLKRCDREFERQLDRALVQRELILLAHIREASKNSWKAAAWLLAHTVGGRYGEHVLTFDEELDAEESEKFAATMNALQRPASEPDPEFGPYGPLAKSQDTVQGRDQCAAADAEATKSAPTKVTRHDSPIRTGEPASPFEIPGFGKLVPAEAAAGDSSDFINFNDPLSTVKRIPPLAATPASATTRPTPLPAAATKFGKVSQAQIRESMRALDDYLKS